MTNEKLIDEVRTLELEEKKLELENRIACMKAEQSIDECCVRCAGPCVVAAIDEKDSMIRRQRKLIEDLNDELSTYKEDSELLNKVVDAVIPWQLNETGSANTVMRIFSLVQDHLSILNAQSETPIDEEPDTELSFIFLELP